MSDDTLNTLAGIGMEVSKARESQPAPQRRQVDPPRVLMVAEVEVLDGASIWTRDTATTVTAPTGPLTHVQREHIFESFDPADYEPVQPAKIEVRHYHDPGRVIGHAEYLEWGTGTPTRITAVCAIDAAAADEWGQGDSFISPGTRQDRHTGRITLDHLGLCPSTARIAAKPVQWSGTTFDRRSTWTRQTVPGHDLLLRAADARRKRRRGAGIPIVGHPALAKRPEQQGARSRELGPLEADYWRHNGEDGLFYSGSGGRILRVQ
jgi:hypothetical protein